MESGKKPKQYFASEEQVRERHPALFSPDPALTLIEFNHPFATHESSLIELTIRFPPDSTPESRTETLYDAYVTLRKLIPSLSEAKAWYLRTQNTLCSSDSGYNVFFGFNAYQEDSR